MNTLIQLIVILLVCGFIYWAYLKLIALAPIAAPFRQVLDVVVVVLVGFIVLFYAIIPIIRMLPSLLHA